MTGHFLVLLELLKLSPPFFDEIRNSSSNNKSFTDDENIDSKSFNVAQKKRNECCHE
jgi:hypothetical protein